MAQGDPIGASGAALGPVVDSEDYRLTLMERNDRGPGLHSGTLFGQNELSTREVLPRFAEEKGDLEREDELTIEILVETVVIVLLIFEQQGSGATLACLMAEFEKFTVLRRKVCGLIEGEIPLIGNWCKGWIELGAKRLDEFRKRMSIILILSAAETMVRHHDAATKPTGLVITRGEFGALRRGEKRADGGEAMFVQMSCDRRPIERDDFFSEVHGATLFEGGMREHSDLCTRS